MSDLFLTTAGLSVLIALWPVVAGVVIVVMAFAMWLVFWFLVGTVRFVLWGMGGRRH